MIDRQYSISLVHIGALDRAIRTILTAKFDGLVLSSINEQAEPMKVVLSDSAIQADLDTVATLVSSHDPVFLNADKLSVTADGVDTATITVSAPKPGAASVTLLVNGTPISVLMSGGVGTIQITSVDPQTITVGVQSPANRTTDTLSIAAR
jgi:predicted aspartyl protease